MSDDSNASETKSPCRHLYSKSMYVNQGYPVSEHVYENCWCSQTQTIYGPDSKICGGDECQDGTRTCHEEK